MDWDSENASISDLKEKMLPYQKRVWSRQVSFPILLDGTRSTFERYGVDSAGVSVLVDADGNLAKGGIKELKKILATQNRPPVLGNGGP